MSLAASILTEDWTVSDVLRCFPYAYEALNRLGIDTCCGGDNTLPVAAANAGIPHEVLVDAIRPCTALFEHAP